MNRIVLVTIVLGLLLDGCSQGTQEPPGTAFSLLADSRIIAVRLADSNVVAETSLANNAVISAAGQFLVLNKQDNSLIVLFSNKLFVAELPNLRIKRITPLSSKGCIFRSIAIGQSSKKLYVFGNCPESLNVTVFDPSASFEVQNWTVAMPSKYDWMIYQGGVSSDERRLFVSYHGSNTTGIDWFDISSKTLARCQTNNESNVGCIRVHGGFKIWKEKILAASGGRLIIENNSNGNWSIAYDTYLDNNHLMEFAVNSQGTRLYSVGTCGYQDGFSAVSLVNGGVPLSPDSLEPQLSHPAPSPIYKTSQECGVRVALSHDQILVVTETEKTVPNPQNQGALVFIDVNGGRVIGKVATPSEPVDVITDG